MGNCYKFVNSPKVSWSEAHGLCADMGGTLAYLDSWIEIYWLRGYRDTYSNLQTSTGLVVIELVANGFGKVRHQTEL